MLVYLLVFIICFIYYVYAKGNLANSSKLLAFFFVYLALFIGMGDMIGGYDRYIYGDMFDSIAANMHEGRPLSEYYYFIQGFEYGYFYWEVLVSLFSRNRYIFIFTTTILIYIIFYKVFTRYIENYPLACLIFLGLFYYFSMTYLRQVIAAGIAWYSVQYIWERKPVKFFALVLLAYFFHGSASVFFPMYFLPIRKYSKDFVVKFLLVCLVIGLSPLPLAFVGTVSEASDKVGGYEDQDQGFRLEYVLEVIFFVWLFFKKYNMIGNNRKDLTFLNMSFVYCAILLFFMRFGQGGRFGWYYIFGLIYTLTYISDMKKIKDNTRNIVILVSFLLFLRITYSWRTMNIPYKTFLTDGEPAGNGDIYRYYEYDQSYTIDKFYKK